MTPTATNLRFPLTPITHISAVPERVGRSEGGSDMSVRDRDVSGRVSGFASGR
jgi:hypothetical protein